MARRTRPSDHTCVAEFGATERFGAVTSFTAHLGGHVGLWFHHIIVGQTQATGMTTGTVFGGALENPAHVTRFTTCRKVLSRQRKAGLQVVKIAQCALCLQCHGARDENKGKQPFEHTADQASGSHFHDEYPILFVHAQSLSQYPCRVDTISPTETIASTGAPV